MPSEAAAAGLDVDLLSPELRRDPYPFYRQLRDEHPVAFLETPGWFALTRHADVEGVLRSPGEYSSTIMGGPVRSLLGQDPPAHTEVRRLAVHAFDAVREPALEERIATTARSIVRRFAQRGGGDFVGEVAVELPLRVIGFLLGIDEDRLGEFKGWSEAVIRGASGTIPPGAEAEFARRVDDFDGFFGDLISRRRKEPHDDLVGALVREPLDERELRSLAKLLLIAGTETTTNLMGNAAAALLTTPGLQQRVREDPSLCRAWVQETLRYDAPVQIVLRVTRAEVELHGVAIPEGRVVAVFLGSANRDERRHEDPDAFRLGRREPHLAFGAGPHFCLGASLALVQATAGLSILLEETRQIEAAEDPAAIPRIPALQLRGPERLPLAVA